ncbi:MAG: energy-coupled thiamine transporter ThiT [Synergistaceae bacterium]|nr:energy-coupled thiamine transporter ThiT [Synergistaceae bacterium]MBQ3653171.1 energy-coupled thiamine transporter ThiT [Synergistaceae bacterium]
MPTRRRTTSIMIEGALCIALCIVLEKINIIAMPQGGSVDFELIPLLLFTYRRGAKWGVQAGALAGVVKILLGGYFLNVVQVILDYPLAYACVGLAAIRPKVVGLVVAALGQITCSVISGVVFFAQYAPEGQSPLMYSLLYNGPVLGAKYILSGIVAMFMWKVLERDLPVRD